MSEQCKHLSGRDPGNLCERSPAECEYPRCQVTPAAPDVDVEGLVRVLRNEARGFAGFVLAPKAGAMMQEALCNAADTIERLAARAQAAEDENVRLRECVEDADRMREALLRIVQWADAYPEDVFPAVTKEEWKRANVVLDTAGLSLTRISASNMRHVVEGVGKIARMAYEPPDKSAARAALARKEG